MDESSDFEVAAKELAGALGRSVGKAVEGEDRVAVAFSGGVDSSVLVACARKKVRVVACGVSASGAIDASKAKSAAAELGVEYRGTALTRELAMRELTGMNLPFEAGEMDRSLWCLFSMASKSAADSGARVVLLGQLADELFGGYAKYERALDTVGGEAANQMMREDVAAFATRGKVRDLSACSRWLRAEFPFEAKEVMASGLGMPIEFKFKDGARKAVLRRAAVLLGVPEGLAYAPKKAAQYSSGIQKLLGQTILFNVG